MRPLRYSDPADDDDDTEVMKRAIHRRQGLLRGLAAGVAMLAVAAILTFIAALALQYRAREVAQTSASHATASDARRDTVPPASGSSPDGRSVGEATAPAPIPSPGPNPTPAPER